MKTRSLFLSFSLLFLASVTLFCGFFRLMQNASSSIPTVTESTPVIILDAGHGGADGGAVGADGTVEKDLNLALTRTLADLCRAAGYTVAETRTEDMMLYPAGTRAGHFKQQDLNARLTFMRNHPESIFVSIHMNTYPSPACRGLQVWYAGGAAGSAELAAAIEESVRSRLQPWNERHAKAADSRIFLLYHATVPAVLVECGFLTSPEDCSRLSDNEGRRALALAIFCAISANLRGNTCKIG